METKIIGWTSLDFEARTMLEKVMEQTEKRSVYEICEGEVVFSRQLDGVFYAYTVVGNLNNDMLMVRSLAGINKIECAVYPLTFVETFFLDNSIDTLNIGAYPLLGRIFQSIGFQWDGFAHMNKVKKSIRKSSFMETLRLISNH